MATHWPRRICTLALFVACSTFALSQVGGANINMVSGTKWPDGDPFLQRQNEPSAAVSSRNPQHLLAGANDYRTVDIPNPLTPDENGDAWVGVFRSIDGGLTWSSSLLPGYPQDDSAQGMASPLKAYGVATDPTVRAGTHGLFYYSGLVFNRNNGPTGVFVATLQDQNNKGNGNPYTYIGAKIVDTGTSGQFLDKPWLAVDIPRPNSPVGSATCTMGGKTFASGNAYFVYSKFLGGSTANNPHTQILLVRSTNCGASWSNPQKLSEGFQLNQGTVAAIDPNTGALHVAWRQITSGNQPDAILYTVSTDGGKTFAPTQIVYTFATGAAFDLNASSSQFRTIALPAMAVDASSRVWVAFSLRNQGANSAARVMMTTLAPGSTTWTPAFAADTTSDASTHGHQFSPALTFAFGRLMLTFYDQREDNTKGLLICSNRSCTETRQPVGDLAAGRSSLVFNSQLSDAALKVRHTIDVRGALVDPSQFNGSTLPFPSMRISQYVFGSRPGSGPRPIEQLQFNPPNFPMFVRGTRGFIGDYIDIAAQLISADGNGNWVYNKDHSSAAVFHPVWTDNRDVRTPPVVCDPVTNVCTQDWTQYTPVGSTGGPSLFDASQGDRPVCNPAATGTRNQNVYTARITEGLYAAFRENAKVQSTGTIIAREFALSVANNKNTTAYYRLSLTQPPGQYATAFLKDDLTKTVLDVTVLPRSSVSRGVFIISKPGAKLPYPSVRVSIKEIASIGADAPLPNGLSTVAITNPDIVNPDIVNPDIVNPDITNPDIVNPDITNPDITTAEIYNPTITNPDIVNPDITNPDIVNPDIVNPDITNPDIVNPDIVNPDISATIVTNPDIVNPDIVNPDIVNPDIVNPDIVNPDISAFPSNTTDLTWKVTNKGNTTSGYNAKMLTASPICCPPGGTCSPGQQKCQLVLRKTYPIPIANQCTLTVQAQNIAISNIPNPTFTPQNQIAVPDVRSDAENATLTLGPGEAGRMTLRVFGPVSEDQIAGLRAAAVAFGANTNLDHTGVSLTIQTTALPPVFVGVPYTAQLQAVGGTGALSWSVFDGTLPGGLTLNPLTGVISGTPSGSPGTTLVLFRVLDTPLPNGVQQADWKKLSFDSQQFTVSNVTVQKLNTGLAFARNGDSIQANVIVSNLGTLTAGNVIPSISVSPAGAVTCDAPVPPTFDILGGNTQLFTFQCKIGTASGPISFSASATGTFPGGVSVTTGSSSSSSATLFVDNTLPTISSAAATASGAAYTAGGWATEPVTVTFRCLDSDAGIAEGYPTGNQTISTGTSGTNVTGTCRDNAGNESTLSFGPVRIDFDGPVISVSATTSAGAYTAGTWSNKAVSVIFACADPTSGIAAGYPTGSAIITTSTPMPGVTVTGTCKNNGGVTSALTFGPVLVDLTPPVVNISSPAANATVNFGASLTMQFTCSDVPSGIASCSGTPANGTSLDTSTFGTQTVTATAIDNAGNTTTVSSSYKVTYRFQGFETPLVTAGTATSPSISGTFNAGKAIPIKWKLFSAGDAMVTDLGALKLMVATKNAACRGPASGTTFVLYNPTAGAAGGSTFRSSSSGYIFNWDTASVSKGCWNLIVTLKDETQYATIVRLQ